MPIRLFHPACAVAALLVISGAVQAAGQAKGKGISAERKSKATQKASAPETDRQPGEAAVTSLADGQKAKVNPRVRFINYLLKRQEIGFERQAKFTRQVEKAQNALIQNNTLRAQGSIGGRQFRQITAPLNLRLAALSSLLARQTSVLKARLKKETIVLHRLEERAPNSPAIARLELLIAQQTQELLSPVRPAATPVR